MSNLSDDFIKNQAKAYIDSAVQAATDGIIRKYDSLSKNYSPADRRKWLEQRDAEIAKVKEQAANGTLSGFGDLEWRAKGGELANISKDFKFQTVLDSPVKDALSRARDNVDTRTPAGKEEYQKRILDIYKKYPNSGEAILYRQELAKQVVVESFNRRRTSTDPGVSANAAEQVRQSTAAQAALVLAGADPNTPKTMEAQMAQAKNAAASARFATTNPAVAFAVQPKPVWATAPGVSGTTPVPKSPAKPAPKPKLKSKPLPKPRGRR